jgi:hypothetical protein
MSERADLAGTLGINGFHVGTSDSKECTNNRSNKQEQIGTGTEADSLRSIDSEGIGTAVDSSQKLDTPILQQITNSGIRINKTIEQALAEAQQNYGSAAACRAVENALSSLAEQRKVGTVRNPGGFFVAALRRGFTSNEGKKKAKQGKAPDLGQLEMQIDSYLLDGHRDWAEDKLQAVWSDGWESHVRSMLKNRKDWGFAVSDQGVKNDQST